MHKTDEPVPKAFVLCDEITESPGATGQKDLRGAGMSVIKATAEFPIKHTFWVYIEIVDEKPNATIHLVLTRADSGRSVRSRTIEVTNADPLVAMRFGFRVFD